MKIEVQFTEPKRKATIENGIWKCPEDKWFEQILQRAEDYHSKYGPTGYSPNYDVGRALFMFEIYPGKITKQPSSKDMLPDNINELRKHEEFAF